LEGFYVICSGQVSSYKVSYNIGWTTPRVIVYKFKGKFYGIEGLIFTQLNGYFYGLIG